MSTEKYRNYYYKKKKNCIVKQMIVGWKRIVSKSVKFLRDASWFQEKKKEYNPSYIWFNNLSNFDLYKFISGEGGKKMMRAKFTLYTDRSYI